jgi:hypothetical protein
MTNSDILETGGAKRPSKYSPAVVESAPSVFGCRSPVSLRLFSISSTLKSINHKIVIRKQEKEHWAKKPWRASVRYFPGFQPLDTFVHVLAVIERHFKTAGNRLDPARFLHALKYSGITHINPGLLLGVEPLRY